MDNKESQLNKAASLMGKKGSQALIKKHGLKHFKKISKLGAKARWKDHIKKSKEIK